MSPGKSPFPHFALSKEDINELHNLARGLVTSSLAEHDKYLKEKRENEGRQRSLIDESTWKFTSEREKLRAYIGRTTNSKETSWTATVATEQRQSVSDPVLQRESFMEPQLDHLAVMLVVGTVAGTMEDMMYGTMNNTAEASLVKSSYVNDTESGVVVLHTLEAPSIEDPFRSSMVKYIEIIQGSVIRQMVKKRDYVFLELTGVAPLPSTGELIGYHLMHSVHFPHTPTFDYAIRANMSVAVLSRLKPGSTNEVELFVKGVSDPGGKMIRAIASSSLATALCSTGRNVDCANMKKLAWFVRNASKKTREARDESNRTSLVGCVTCTKVPLRAKLGDLISNSRKCQVCFGYVCSSCRIKKKLSFIRAITGKLVQRDLPFCSACIYTAVTTSSLAVARQEIIDEVGADNLHLADSDLFSTGESDIYSDRS